MADRRRPPAGFEVPADGLTGGYYSDAYFVRARDILIGDGRDPVVTMQVFCRSEALLAGIDEALAVVRAGCRNWSELDVRALHDGDEIEARETVLTIQGPVQGFIHLETALLGVLARRSRIATQTRAAVTAAGGKDVFYFPARHDHYLVQSGDGLAAHVAGAAAVSTDAQGAWFDGRGGGTVPHALIAAYGGDTVAATEAFHRHMGPSVAVVALVDFDNDSVGTSLAVAERLGEHLSAVRLDTSESLVDLSLQGGEDDPALRGVNATLVHKVRDALDDAGHRHVRIVVSGGFDAQRIATFEAAGVPVDAYGVGSSLVRNDSRYDFTADLVEVDGEPCAKVGRGLKPNPRLTPVL